MKWIELNDKKYPEFNKEVLFIVKLNNFWRIGSLSQIIKREDETLFSFNTLEGDFLATHYMEIELPKK
jgi:hypothetical protein